MSCVLDDSMANHLWPSLLIFSRFLADLKPPGTKCVSFLEKEGEWRFSPHLPSLDDDVQQALLVPLDRESMEFSERERTFYARAAVFHFGRFQAGEQTFELIGEEFPDDDCLAIFRLYLPLLLGRHHAEGAGRPFITAHVAQTLDGRIACLNGHSQWISNEANLQHAHRLRALHDAVLVGGRTVESDDPQLTVRRVEGKDPVRVALSGSASILTSGSKYRLFAGEGGLVLCSAEAAKRMPDGNKIDGVRVLPLKSTIDSRIAPDDVCDALFREGLHSIFLEGGGLTVSRFLESRLIDLLHVHIAPLVLGSGVSSFTLPEVKKIQEGRRFRMRHFGLGGELLLECRELH